MSERSGGSDLYSAHRYTTMAAAAVLFLLFVLGYHSNMNGMGDYGNGRYTIGQDT